MEERASRSVFFFLVGVLDFFRVFLLLLLLLLDDVLEPPGVALLLFFFFFLEVILPAPAVALLSVETPFLLRLKRRTPPDASTVASTS